MYDALQLRIKIKGDQLGDSLHCALLSAGDARLTNCCSTWRREISIADTRTAVPLVRFPILASGRGTPLIVRAFINVGDFFELVAEDPPLPDLGDELTSAGALN